MLEKLSPLDKFNFLLGSWNLEYKIPKSKFSNKAEGEGQGEFKRILNNSYVSFDYTAKLDTGEAAAHAIFAWDEKSKLFRYWWFEDSGNFMKATCEFINEETLSLNWHDSVLVQTFHKKKNDNIVLQMKFPIDENHFDTILEVIFRKLK